MALPEGGQNESRFARGVCSNPTTGFGWEEPEIGNGDVLRQLGHESIPPEGEKPPPGAPGEM